MAHAQAAADHHVVTDEDAFFDDADKTEVLGKDVHIVRRRDGEPGLDDFNGRNRRPPRDPINALLSFAYSLLTREWTMVLSAVGLDPYRGFYHQMRFGRPSLALDMMAPK